MLASSLSLVVGQRIARRICPNCREEYQPDKTNLEELSAVLGKFLAEKKKKLSFSEAKDANSVILSYYGRVGILKFCQ